MGINITSRIGWWMASTQASAVSSSGMQSRGPFPNIGQGGHLIGAHAKVPNYVSCFHIAFTDVERAFGGDMNHMTHEFVGSAPSSLEEITGWLQTVVAFCNV